MCCLSATLLEVSIEYATAILFQFPGARRHRLESLPGVAARRDGPMLTLT